MLVYSIECANVAHLFVDPKLGHDANDGFTMTSALRTLAMAQQRLRQALEESSQQSFVINLLPGWHRVPAGGLLLDLSDSAADGHAVHWQGWQGGTSVSGGEPVSGWKLANDPTLPTNVYSAPAPAALRGTTARHFFVDGLRAVRTRQNASKALPGLALDARPECLGCSYSLNSTDALSWSNPSDVEFVYSGVSASWAEERCSVDSVAAVSAADGKAKVQEERCQARGLYGLERLLSPHLLPRWACRKAEPGQVGASAAGNEGEYDDAACLGSPA